jgi:hypothetical protein
MEATCFLKQRLKIAELYGYTSQKIDLTVAVVRTSNPTFGLRVFVIRSLRVKIHGSCCNWVALLSLFGHVACVRLGLEAGNCPGPEIKISRHLCLRLQANGCCGVGEGPRLIARAVKCCVRSSMGTEAVPLTTIECILSLFTYHIYSHLSMLFAYVLRSFIHSFTYACT